jgi:tellurite resistance protein
MTVRKILSARAARPQVEGMLEALVDAAVYIGGSDGRFGEDELNVFIDSMREVVSSAVGDQFLDTMASTARLLDLARSARKALIAKGAARFLAELVARFPGPVARDGLVLSYRIVLADGKVTEKEALAFEALAKALGVEVEETTVLKQLASQSETASQGGYRGSSIEQLQSLVGRVGPAQGRTLRPGVTFPQPSGGSSSGDAGESVLHVRERPGTGLTVCFFGEALPALLAVLDGIKASLVPATLGEKLAAVRAVCPELFVKHDGRFAKL